MITPPHFNLPSRSPKENTGKEEWTQMKTSFPPGLSFPSPILHSALSEDHLKPCHCHPLPYWLPVVFRIEVQLLQLADSSFSIQLCYLLSSLPILPMSQSPITPFQKPGVATRLNSVSLITLQQGSPLPSSSPCVLQLLDTPTPPLPLYFIWLNLLFDTEIVRMPVSFPMLRSSFYCGTPCSVECLSVL